MYENFQNIKNIIQENLLPKLTEGRDKIKGIFKEFNFTKLEMKEYFNYYMNTLDEFTETTEKKKSSIFDKFKEYTEKAK